MIVSIGSTLKQARSARKLSLADVSKETKIQPWVLEALEADRLHDVMSPVYLKGFLMTYARFLHLEPEPLIAQLLPSIPPEPIQATLPPPAQSMPPLLQWRRTPLIRRRLVAALATGGLVALAVLVNPMRWVPKRFAMPRMNASKLASVTPVKVSEPVTPPSLQTVALLPTQPLELAVSAHSTTWIQVRADGKLLSQQRLLRGANERWSAHKRFELVIAKPSQVDLTLNGQSISPFAIAHHGRLLITHHGVTRLADEE